MYPSLGNLLPHITITSMKVVILIQKYFTTIVHSHCVISTRWLSFPLAIKSTFVKVAKSQIVFSISSHLQKLQQNDCPFDLLVHKIQIGEQWSIKASGFITALHATRKFWFTLIHFLPYLHMIKVGDQLFCSLLHGWDSIFIIMMVYSQKPLPQNISAGSVLFQMSTKNLCLKNIQINRLMD